MSLNFPNSPSTNDTHVTGGSTWIFNGEMWVRQGTRGAQGLQGLQGNQGTQGLQGLSNQGVQGNQGLQGRQGTQGLTGAFGGATFTYGFLTNTANSDPGTGKVKFNNSNFSSATTLFIDDEDDNGTDIQSYLRTIDDSTSGIKGHFKVADLANPDDFALFTITASSTEESGYFSIPVSFVSGSATSFSNGDNLTVTFARTGDKGDTGIQGLQGLQGNQGVQGLQGNQGVQGLQGLQGNQGVQGLQGLSNQGVQGNQGLQGLQGNQGTQGLQGTQGNQGTQGLQGNQGTQGLQGNQGVQGLSNQGTQGLQGLQGIHSRVAISTESPSPADVGDFWYDSDDSALFIYYDSNNDGTGDQWIEIGAGPTGAQGTQGTQGLQGHQGLQGNQGTQGLQGLQGNQGTQGLQGLQGNQGVQGTQGLQGLQGNQGTQGTQGLQGTQGTQGLQGNQGVQGLQGLQGNQGTQGLQGLQGNQGTQGLQGLQGNQGTQGLQGLQGTQGRQGTQGTQGLQGSQGLQGTQGNQGLQGLSNQGVQGLQGLQGNQGVQGLQGLQGNQGVQGLQGNQGVQGTQGLQGLQGNQGTQGLQGLQGNQGIQGLQGLSNQGVQGTQGLQGRQGTQGLTGAFGGATFSYDFNTNTSGSDPGAGKLSVNNSNLTSATLLLLDDVDENGTDIQAFLRTIDDSTSTLKGHVKISSSVQPDDFVIYTISSTSELSGHHRVDISYVSGSVTSFSNGQDLVATFARTGDKGDTGNQGTQGLSNQGVQGLQGLQGITARVAISTESPSPADVGDFWYDNDDSALFIYYDSNQDGTGDQWIEIGAGPTGAQGLQGVQATQGVQGTQGLQGLQGNQGVQGLQGNQGVQGTQGLQGNQGVQGVQGTQGRQGLQGLQGNQGTQGTQGTQGRQGLQGLQGNQGTQGTQGRQGTQGTLGRQGTQGTLGRQGTQGTQGRQGTQGTQGVQGRDGQNAGQGTQGVQGLAGTSAGGSNGVDYDDNVKVRFGDDEDMEMYFSGTKFNIQPKTTSTTSQLDFAAKSQVYIHSIDNGVFLRSKNQSVIDLYGGYGGGIYFKNNGTQYLKLEYGNWTTQNNADWTFSGTDYDIVFDASDSALEFADNAKAKFGTGGDLEIYHNGSDSFITDNSRHLIVRADGSGDLYLQSDNRVILSDIGGNETFIECNDNGNVELYYDNSKKFETTSDGAKITGGLQDKDGQLGSSGQVLSSTGTELNWVDADSGPQGVQGLQGLKGNNGSPGSNGAQGVAGSDGTIGVDGAQGTAGVQGAIGPDGGNAGTLDNLDSTSFLRSDADDSFSGTITGNSDSTNPVFTIDGAGPNFVRFLDDGSVTTGIDLVFRTSPNTLGFEKSTDGTKLWETDCDNGVTNFRFTPTVSGNNVLTTANEGSGNGIDADTVDGIEASSFLRSDANDTGTGQLTLQQDSSSSTNFSLHIRNQQSAPAQIKFSNNSTGQNGFFFYRHEDSQSNSAANSFHFNSTESSTAVIIDQTSGNSGFYVGTNRCLTTADEGSGNGIDADTLDGVQASSFLRSDTADTMSRMLTVYTNMSSQDDWNNSPISIRERDAAGAGDGEDRDSPNLNFHWGSRVSNSLWMNASGHLNWGSYSGSGVPNDDGTFKTGDVTASGSVTANSDIKLKKNINTIDNALDKVLNLRGVEFDYIANDKHSIGVIAQEVEEVLPDLIHTDENTDIKSVAYGNLTAVLIEAVKELKKENDALSARIKSLEDR